MFNRYRLSAFCALVIALLATLLYVPFLHNALVFDDLGLFNNLTVFDFAQTPFGRPRTFPYFSIGLIHVLSSGNIEANRILSLILHILCAWMLFALLITLQRQALTPANLTPVDEKQLSTKITVLAFIGATWFALNPVAVYGAGYLVQRTILFATLFSLLSLWFYRRAFAENRTVDVITAAAFYGAAVYSKEHAIMLPAVAVALTALYDGDLRMKAKRAGLYLVLCIPSAVAAVRVATVVLANTYEPESDTILLQMPHFSIFGIPVGQWPASIMMQMGFFFDYLGYWAAPDIRALSADMRIDFTSLFTTWETPAKAVLFLACPIGALLLLRRGGTAALFGCGLLYSWFLFITELVTIRFREPFVLYRSYLWAPGFILMGVALCRTLPLKLLLTLSIPVFALFIILARDRLESLSTDGTVWMDAAAKLPQHSIPGDDRIFYNRALQYEKEKKYSEAAQDISYAISKNHDKPQLYYARGLIFYSANDFRKALADFDHALALNAQDGASEYAKGLTLEKLGCLAAATRAHTSGARLGIFMAGVRLKHLAAIANQNERGIKSEPKDCPF